MNHQRKEPQAERRIHSCCDYTGHVEDRRSFTEQAGFLSGADLACSFIGHRADGAMRRMDPPGRNRRHCYTDHGVRTGHSGLGPLFLLLFVNQLLRLARSKSQFSRVEMLTVYTFVAIASALAGVGVTRFWIATITALWWYQPSSADFGYLQQYLPWWVVPHNYDLVMGIYMGGGAVPWKVWLTPIFAWTGFFVAAWCAVLCLLVMVRKRWTQEERLSFPVVELALEMTDTSENRSQRPFFLNPVMWVGFGLTTAFNLLNILHALRPTVPGIALNTPLGPTNASLPWSMVFPINLFLQPLMIGFGFLVSTEISFSIWFFFLVFKLEALLAGSMGYTTTGMPYAQEQGMGAFIFLGLGLLWASRVPSGRPGGTGPGTGGPRETRIPPSRCGGPSWDW